MVRVLCGWLADRLAGGDRLQRPPLLEGGAPLSFFTDAKAEAGRAWIGGFWELVDGCQGPWFSLEVKLFFLILLQVAALELLSTLVGVRLLPKVMTTKFPSMLILMELAEELSHQRKLC